MRRPEDRHLSIQSPYFYRCKLAVLLPNPIVTLGRIHITTRNDHPKAVVNGLTLNDYFVFKNATSFVLRIDRPLTGSMIPNNALITTSFSLENSSFAGGITFGGFRVAGKGIRIRNCLATAFIFAPMLIENSAIWIENVTLRLKPTIAPLRMDTLEFLNLQMINSTLVVRNSSFLLPLSEAYDEVKRKGVVEDHAAIRFSGLRVDNASIFIQKCTTENYTASQATLVESPVPSQGTEVYNWTIRPSAAVFFTWNCFIETPSSFVIEKNFFLAGNFFFSSFPNSPKWVKYDLIFDSNVVQDRVLLSHYLYSAAIINNKLYSAVWLRIAPLTFSLPQYALCNTVNGQAANDNSTLFDFGPGAIFNGVEPCVTSSAFYSCLSNPTSSSAPACVRSKNFSVSSIEPFYIAPEPPAISHFLTSDSMLVLSTLRQAVVASCDIDVSWNNISVFTPAPPAPSLESNVTLAPNATAVATPPASTAATTALTTVAPKSATQLVELKSITKSSFAQPQQTKVSRTAAMSSVSLSASTVVQVTSRPKTILVRNSMSATMQYQPSRATTEPMNTTTVVPKPRVTIVSVLGTPDLTELSEEELSAVPSAARAVSTATTTAAMSAAALGGAAAGPAAADLQALVLLGSLGCATAATRGMSKSGGRSVTPIQLDWLGPELSSVLGSVAILVVVMAIQLIATVVYCNTKSVSFVQSAAKFQFPNFIYVALMLLFQGLSFQGFGLLLNSGKFMFQLVGGGVLLVIISPALVGAYLVRSKFWKVHYVSFREEFFSAIPIVSRCPSDALRKRIFPVGYWIDVAPREDGEEKQNKAKADDDQPRRLAEGERQHYTTVRFGSSFRSARGPSYLWVQPLVLLKAILVSVFASLPPGTVSCNMIFFLLGAFHVFQFVLILYFRPYRIGLANTGSCIINLLTALAMLFSTEGAEFLHNAVPILLVSCMGSTIVVLILVFVLRRFEAAWQEKHEKEIAMEDDGESREKEEEEMQQLQVPMISSSGKPKMGEGKTPKNPLAR